MVSLVESRLTAQLELVGNIMQQDGHEKLYVVTRGVLQLGKIAHQLHKRYENACNYAWATEEKYQRRTEKLEEKAVDIGKELGVVVGHQRDPRGWPLIVAIGTTEHRLG